MFKDKLSILVEKDRTIIKCKKLAKVFFHSYKSQHIKKSLMQCQSLAAIELGYQDYFDVQNTIKKKQEFLSQGLHDENIELLKKILVDSVDKKVDYVSIEVRKNVAYIIFSINGNKVFFNEGNAYNSIYIRDFCQSVIYYLSEISNIQPQIFTTNNLICLNSIYTISVNNIKTELSLEVKSMPSYPDGYDFFIKPYVLMQKERTLKELGFEKNQVEQFYNALNTKNGLIMIGGANSSGRTSTLKSLIEYISADKRKNIYNLSQPLEFKVENVHNINVQETKYNYFPYIEPIKIALNDKAEVIFIDKINDQSTTSLIYEASKKALVGSTVNANSIFKVLERFKDGGLSKEQIGEVGFLKLIVYQKLMPVVCNKCCLQIEDINNINDIKLKNEYKRFFKHFKNSYPEVNVNNIKLRNNQGCDNCHNIGIMGRTVCSEIIEIDSHILDLIRQEKIEQCKKYWKSFSDKKINSSNMQGKSTLEHALYKMLQGYIDPLDIERNFLNIEDFIIHINE